jgi:hypothetical protein
VTADHLRAANEYILHDIARWNIYAILSSANVPVRFRTSDIVNDAPFNAAMINHLGPYADSFYMNALANVIARTAITNFGFMIIHALFANALHRAFCNNHNWYSHEMHRGGSMTRRCLAVLGSELRLFTTYMEKHGHDGNHHLSTPSLNAICDAISGLNVATCPDINRMYAGKDLANMPVHVVLKATEAATDRWPATQMGKSAVIVSLMLVEAVYVHMSTVLKIEGADMLAACAASLANFLKTTTIDRDGVTRVNTVLAHLVAVTYGYACQASILDPDRFGALKSHAGRTPASESAGRSLAIHVMKTTPNKDAIVNAVKTTIITMARSIAVVCNIVGDTDTGEMIETFDASALTATAGDDDQTKLEKLLRMTKGGVTEKAQE